MKVEHTSDISAECIAASVYAGGQPIYTVVTRSPKFIDAEMRTHRMLSQNSSSSRAIPVTKVIEQVEQSPYIPFEWRKNQAGMQGYEAFDCPDSVMILESEWVEAANDAVRAARQLNSMGVHKQHVNRLLEPFAWQWKVITATEWGNFFDLRCHPAAQPEMQALAGCIRDEIDKSKHVDRTDGSWHLPFITEDERKRHSEKSNILVSAARCARISYANHGDKIINRDKDVELAKKLITDHHCTPFEHQAKPFDGHWSGNFYGWRQHRKSSNTMQAKR